MTNESGFQCPKCGGSHAGAVEMVPLVYPIKSVEGEDRLNFGEEQCGQKFTECSGIVKFVCMDCGTVLRDKNGHKLENDAQFVSWVYDDCPGWDKEIGY